MQELSEYKFAISPQGNGVDCHRTWECLYLGVIPIITKSLCMSFFEELPILFVDNYDCITEEYLLEEYKIVTHQKIVDLESIEEKTGPIYLINIDIHKMNFDIFRYSLYDVLFLPDLIKKFLSKSQIYTKLIPEISQIIFQYKRNIPSINFSFIDIKEIVNKYNIHFINIFNKKIQLDQIYQYHWLTISDNEWTNLTQITYFKNFFEILFRYLVYYNISKTQSFYIKKENIANKIKLINLSAYPYINELILRLNNKIIKYL